MRRIQCTTAQFEDRGGNVTRDKCGLKELRESPGSHQENGDLSIIIIKNRILLTTLVIWKHFLFSKKEASRKEYDTTNHLILAIGDPKQNKLGHTVLTSDLQNCDIINGSCFKLLNLLQCVLAAKEN